MKDGIRKPIAAELLIVRFVLRVVVAHAVRILLVASLFVVCFLSARPAEAAPVIQLMTPQSGPVGTLVAIVGSGFGASQGTSTVTFNGTLVTWVSWSATSLQVQVPAGATSGNVVVTVSGKASNTKSFTVTPPPVISSLSPTSGPVGATVNITGSNFTAGGTQSPQVVFNPELFANPISSTATSITVAVPAGASTGDLLVSVGGGNSNSVLFTVTSSDPSISSLAPSGGVVGTAVVIKGTNFGSSQGTSTVTFNGTTGIPTSWNATSINVPVPTGATTGNVLVTVGGVASNPYGFEVGTAVPNITSISPTSGVVATSVTIKGTGFGSTQGTNTVSFNGVSGVPTSWSATQIKVPVPAGATTGSVVVTASGTVSNAVNFSVPGTGPSITGLSPSSGPVGALVTITGTDFGATQGASTVTFNGIAVTATGWSPTSIVATVPLGATSGSLVVTVSSTASNGLNFTVVPTITSLSPTSGGGGTSVTINGNSFGSSQGTSTVTFNGTTATPTTWGASSITVPVPAGAATGNVVVTVGGVASNGVSFSVVTLTSLSITPQNSTIQAGNTQQFSATGTYSDNSTQNLTATATWTSSATSIATINNSGLATAVGSGQTTIQATVGSVQASTSLTVSGFALTGSLITGRNGQTATLLNSGMVLIVGGYGINGALASAELYNPITGSFTATGSLNTPRTNDTVTLLDNGTVLIAGGFDSNGNLLASAEIYNPATGVFTLTAGSLGTARANHTATLLGNGTVLIVGSADSSGNVSASAEIYNAATQTFTSTGSLNTARGLHTAALLNDGTVLILGGGANGTVLSSAELYNVVSGTFTASGSLNTGRGQNTTTLLNSGSVLVAGGSDVNGNALASAELYNPTTMTFTSTGSLTTARGDHAATLLNNGMVLVEGGYTSSADMTASAELYDPVGGTFSQTGSLNVARQVQSATLLSNGFVLVVGGFSDNSFALNSAELYEPTTFVPHNLVSIAVSPSNPSIPVGGAQDFTAMGTFSDNGTQTLTSVGWNSSNTGIATISNDSSNRGVASGLATGSATVSACTGQICGSTTLTVVPAPSIAALFPTTAPVGAIVTISGTNFGTSQSSVSVTFNGVVATVIGWSSTTVATRVPGGATTGNVVLTVSGARSNGVTFTIVAAQFPPSISATISPVPNASNWNNTNVTVSYSCSAGGNVSNGGVALPQNGCSQPQTVATEGANQQVTGAVTDAGGNTSSVTTVLNIDKTPPAVTISSPVDGTGFTSSAVTISGSVSDSLSGLAFASCNGTSVTVTSGSFSCNISLNIGVNLVMVQATDNAGNVGASALHLSLVAPLSTPASIQVTPASANVLIGGTQQFTAIDQLGRPRTDATWTVDNTSIAIISTDASPILTGVTAGIVTLTASIGSVSAQTQVHILSGTSFPAGTVVWSAPSIPGFTTQRVIQAVPTNNGPDLFTLDTDGNTNYLIRAFSANGQQFWQNMLSPTQLGFFLLQAMGDSTGGLLLATEQGMTDFDGQSGAVGWQNSTVFTSVSNSFQAAIGQDGSIYSPDDTGHLLKIDPVSGNGAVVYTSPQSVAVTESGICLGPQAGVAFYGSQTTTSFAIPTAPVIDAAGNAFFTTSQTNASGHSICVDNGVDTSGTETSTTQYFSIKLSPDGSTSATNLPISQPLDNENSLAVLAPDGNGGALIQWVTGQINNGTLFASMMATSTGSTYPSPLGGLTGIALGENGNAFGTNNTSAVAFDHLNSGQTQWSYQPPSGVSQIWTAEGGGMEVLDNSSNQAPLDASGNVGASASCLGAVSPLALSNWMTIANNVFSVTSCGSFEPGSSPWVSMAGDPPGGKSSPKLRVATMITRAPGFNAPWDSPTNAAGFLNGKISTKGAYNRNYIDTGKYTATVPNFLTAIGDTGAEVNEVVGFIGDSDLVSCAGAILNTNCPFSEGLIFIDAHLIRTPNCNDPTLGACYYLDTTSYPVPPEQFCPGGRPATGYFFSTVTGGCSNISPPCAVGSSLIGKYCFKFPIDPKLPATVVDPLLATAKVVFIGACDITSIFQNWWALNLNSGRSLVVPDLTAMATLNANNTLIAPQNQGTVDLIQALVGYQALVNALASGTNVGDAVIKANAAISASYAVTNYTQLNPHEPVLPQVVYKPVGSASLCISASCIK